MRSVLGSSVFFAFFFRHRRPTLNTNAIMIKSLPNRHQVVHALPLPDKKRFLKFVTGSDRAPVGGLGNLRITVQREADSERLPTTHTCFNTLVLPQYGSRRAGE